MKNRVRIREAVDYYNLHKSNDKPMMTIKSLSDTVIQDRNNRAGTGQISVAQKQTAISKMNNGKLECPHHYLKAIAEETGVSTDYLVGLTETQEGHV